MPNAGDLVRRNIRLKRIYDRPQTPLDRLRATKDFDRTAVNALLRLRATTDPFELARIIEQKIERIAALHRVGQPMDVAGAIVFLASPAASLITGHTILIDGGWTSR